VIGVISFHETNDLDSDSDSGDRNRGVGTDAPDAWYGTNHSGAAAPLTQREIVLRDSLRRDVQKLAGEIGERNLVHYEALSAAANYLEQGFDRGRIYG
jgi:hypothetical protein